MIAVSACLAGVNCKYNGKSNLNEKVRELIENNEAVLICPEELGGLSTPRVPSEILGGTAKDVLEGKAKVITKDGRDVTKEFIDGGYRALAIVKANKVTKAVLKANSPSCGSRKVYDGSFSGNLIAGVGITAEIFRQNDIEVISEEQL